MPKEYLKPYPMEREQNGYNLSMHGNRFELSYDDVGQGDIPIIFLHGFPFDKTMWRAQLDYFKPSYRMIACDVRGFGQSKDEESPLSIDLFGNDLITFMNGLQVDKAVVCGLSMGGYIALNAYEKFPARFEALVLCDTQCIADTIDLKVKRYNTISEIEAGGARSFNEKFIKKVFHEESLTDKKELVAQVESVVFANSDRIISEGLAALAERAETCTSLGEVVVPTLILCGSDDEVTPLAQSEAMHEAIQGSVLQVIQRAGHVSNLEQPDQFNKHLSDFLLTISSVGVEEWIGSHRRHQPVVG